MEKKQKFLEKVVDFLLNGISSEFQDIVVVFPNHRSIVFLKKYLSQKTEKNIWLPDMMTIDDLMTSLSDLTVIDPLLVDFELFKIHKEIAGSDARSLDDFLGWSPMIVSDFSDIDYYLADASKLFDELSEIKVIEKWNLGIGSLTQMQKNYLDFFRSLSEYYDKLHKRLFAGNKAYKAMAYRQVAESIDDKIAKGLNWKHFVFVGINALTPAEVKVVKKLSEETVVDYLIDADRFYFNNQKGKPLHEASVFLKKALSELNIESPRWINDNLLEEEKNVEVKGVPKQIGQVRYAGKKLFEWMNQNSNNLQNTAVVLADENLLMPLLSYVPVEFEGQTIPYNVTLGYPLTESPLYHLVAQWLELLIEQKNSKGKFPLSDLLAFFKNPVFELMSPVGITKLVESLKSVNTSFPDEETVELFSKESGVQSIYGTFFKEIKRPVDIFDGLIRFLENLQNHLEDSHNLMKYQLGLMFGVLKNLSLVLSEAISELGFQALRKIILREMQKQQVSLKGEPLSGIQIMGLLETRNLDFDHLIILSANEGILPKTSFQDSFIPFDLKRSYNLPLPNNKTAVFSYHLFRLMQRAKNIVFVYNTEPDALGGGEPSRFILQMEHELTKANPKIGFTNSIVSANLDGTELESDISVNRTEEVKGKLNQLAATGISPSAINTFINCPLQFYLNYVLRVKIPDQPETAVESDTFGSVIHGVLQNVYKQFEGKEINAEVLKLEKKNLDRYLSEQFQKYYGQSDLTYGKNRLIYQVAHEYLKRYLDSEIKISHKRKLMGVEVDVSHTIHLEGKTLRFKGKIDRIDQYENTIQILDYKTGKVEKKDVTIKDINELFSDVKYSKALQVSTYAWLYNKRYPSKLNLQSGLISLRLSTGEVFNVSYSNTNVKNWDEELEEGLRDLLKEIFFEEKPFHQTRDVTHCKYCNFKNICNR